jgi:hypothetical protein
MKSIKTNPNSAKGPDKGKIVNKYVLKSNRGRTKTLTDSTRKRHKKEALASFV